MPVLNSISHLSPLGWNEIKSTSIAEFLVKLSNLLKKFVLWMTSQKALRWKEGWWKMKSKADFLGTKQKPIWSTVLPKSRHFSPDPFLLWPLVSEISSESCNCHTVERKGPVGGKPLLCNLGNTVNQDNFRKKKKVIRSKNLGSSSDILPLYSTGLGLDSELLPEKMIPLAPADWSFLKAADLAGSFAARAFLSNCSWSSK